MSPGRHRAPTVHPRREPLDSIRLESARLRDESRRAMPLLVSVPAINPVDVIGQGAGISCAG